MFGRIFEGTLAISHILVMFALDGGALRRFRPPPGSRTLRSARSMVAALIESKPAQPPAQVPVDPPVQATTPGSLLDANMVIAVTALFGQMPMHRVRMMRTSRR